MNKPNPKIPFWIQQRILGFFNQAKQVTDLLDGTIQDDPADGPGRTLGPSLAARILRQRQELPQRRFTSFDQLDQVRGVGPATIDDLVYSLGQTAAATFRQQMYETRVIFESNWPLVFYSFDLVDPTEFDQLVNHPAALRIWLRERIDEIGIQQKATPQDIQSMQAQLPQAYLDRYSNSTDEAALALALWFYRFDADNWFSWQRILEQTTAYFNHHQSSNTWQMDLILVKGFQQQGILDPGVAPTDLPLVVNWAEQRLTLWFSVLFD